MNKKIWKICPAVLIIVSAGVLFCLTRGNGSEIQVSDSKLTQEQMLSEPKEEKADTSQEEEGIWVYVYGCVQHPGVYYLPQDSRAFEAIEKAGGMTESAASGTLNLAMTLEDGQQICVPSSENLTMDQTDLIDSDTLDSRININTASAEELATLPGIGETKANAIITYRQKKSFETIEEIMNVPGIKESSFEKIRELIRT